MQIAESEVGQTVSPLITAIIPTYRRPQLLRRAISSVLEQEDASLQVCIYDNASGDETADVVASLAAKDGRVIYHRHPTNIGGIANFLFGMSRVETPFFSLLSDDDYLLPGFYRRALTGLIEAPQAICWAGMTLNVDERGVIWDARVRHWAREGLLVPPDGFMAMTGGMAPTWTGILFRREVLDLVGAPDAEVLGPSDLEYLLRLAARFPYVLQKHPSAVFTLNSASFSATQPMSSFWPGWKRMLEKFSTDDTLDDAFKKQALHALNEDARRMLFRRGANALAGARYDFVRDAVDVLKFDCGLAGRAGLLRVLAAGCKRMSIMQQAYTIAYRLAECHIVDSRKALQAEYGSLLRMV
jgi:glycosyltransferase involved in cell wall biosynthesis